MNTKTKYQINGITMWEEESVERRGGTIMVRVHEVNHPLVPHRHRYFLSLNGKVRESTFRLGELGVYGTTKAEARQEAERLADRVAAVWDLLDKAKLQALLYDVFSNRYLLELRLNDFRAIVDRYNFPLHQVEAGQ